MKTKSDSQRMKIVSFCLTVFVFALFISCQCDAPEKTANRVSEFAKYNGYSEPVYDEWVRTSEYIEVRDGTKLAADIIRPVMDGKPVTEPLPLIWMMTRYHRAHYTEDGGIETVVEEQWYSPFLKNLIQHGYIIACLDARATGASFGTSTQDNTMDAYDVTEWFAVQPWCDGNIGMYGHSYCGLTQLSAAQTAPPHLKTIIPGATIFDFYNFVNAGGVMHDDFLRAWGSTTRALDLTVPIPPVDEDTDGKMLEAAREERKDSIMDVLEVWGSMPYRNSTIGPDKIPFHEILSFYNNLDALKQSKIPIYHWNGWIDIFTRDTFQFYTNLDNPQKLAIGPWSHMQIYPDFTGVEFLRWYDYWLKGVDNGIMDEEPINYFTMGAPAEHEWRSTSQWPLLDENLTPFYFNSGKSGATDSINDGILSRELPSETAAHDEYRVNYTVTVGKPSRWSNAYADGGKEFTLPPMLPVEEKSLTYTTAFLEQDIEVTGHPIVHIWVTSTSKDGDFFVYLEEVDETGVSNYITEGILRASHRTMSEPSFDNLGLPWHHSFEEDIIDLPDKPAELVFDMQPTSNIFDKGNRIRITVTCSDKDNFLTPQVSPAPQVTLYRSTDYPSHVVLPVIPAHSHSN